MKTIRDLILESNAGDAFDSSINISKKEFDKIRQRLESIYVFMFDEKDQLSTIYIKSDSEYGIGEHVGTYVYKTGKLFFDKDNELCSNINKK